ncbi:MAG: hypothetical protein HS101_07845 [Planctomycetia bacterium]|nr:hypothetical protein [Planctomycetia bacterium]
MSKLANIRFIASVFTVLLTLAITTPLSARPSYGQSCITCHSSNGFGHTVTDAMLDVVGTNSSIIPVGQFGDPDRGEGPLDSYSATPGGTFELVIQLSDPNPLFNPSRWAVGFKNVGHTDPDYQAGNADPMTWRDAQLLLAAAQEYGEEFPNDPAPVPLDESEWTLYTDYFLNDGAQYYASTGDGGHDWTGPTTLNLTVTVPSVVLPGWYDLEVSVEGWDYDHMTGSYAFYDEEHFYLNVVPEPSLLMPMLAVAFAMISQRAKRLDRRNRARAIQV